MRCDTGTNSDSDIDRGTESDTDADSGSTSVEMVVLAAAMFASLLLSVQAAAWGLAELACRHAANHALQTTRVDAGTADAGDAAARAVLDQAGGSLVTDPRVDVERGIATASVTVQGRAPRILPFLRLPVGATVSAPVETLDPETLGFGNPDGLSGAARPVGGAS